ncbi:hypothetical protein [Flavonifractor phage Chenonceau]|nr:hypothetical protein [Flavonifractor phage Chenonceau]
MKKKKRPPRRVSAKSATMILNLLCGAQGR